MGELEEVDMGTLVTGGTGFIGSNIVRELVKRGHKVTSVDIAKPDNLMLRYLDAWSDQVSWVQGDILDKATLQKIADDKSISKIVHAAVYTGIREDIEREDSRRIIDINLSGTANVLDLARNLSVERFVYVSSGGVYEGVDAYEGLMTEDTPLHPRSLYSATKYASELMTQRYGELHGFETACVRLGGPYGPMERTTGHRAVMSILQVWTGKALRGEPIEAVKDGAWDFTYVLDIAADCTRIGFPGFSVTGTLGDTLGDLPPIN